MSQGLFITFEGGEGAGKSTQIKLLSDYIIQQYQRNVVVTREPGGSAGAEEIRSLLLKGESGRWDKISELLLFSAARRDHLVKKIWPAMEQGSIVLSDRFADSTIAYQCFGYGYNQEMFNTVNQLYQIIAGDFQPNLTFILDLDVETGLARSRKRAGNDEQRFEDMQLTFHQNLRNGFLTLAKNNPERYVLIDASQSVQDIHDQIVTQLNKRISL